jgi:hypothetical protein
LQFCQLSGVRCQLSVVRCRRLSGTHSGRLLFLWRSWRTGGRTRGVVGGGWRVAGENEKAAGDGCGWWAVGAARLVGARRNADSNGGAWWGQRSWLGREEFGLQGSEAGRDKSRRFLPHELAFRRSWYIGRSMGNSVFGFQFSVGGDFVSFQLSVAVMRTRSLTRQSDARFDEERRAWRAVFSLAVANGDLTTAGET